MNPSVQAIVDRAVERSESQLAADAELDFEALVLTVAESLSAKGGVEKSDKSVYARYPLNGAVYDELIEKEGRLLTEKEARKEKEKRAKFIREVQDRIARGDPPQPEDERQVRFDRKFMRRYRTELIGEESLRGHSCWVVYFEPRDGKLPVRRRMDEALNKSTGKLWIAQDDYGLVRAEFEMREPIRYLAGLLATVRNVSGRLEFDRIEPNVWFPTDFALKLDMRIVFKNIRRNIKMTWSEYRRTEPGQIPRLSRQDPVAH